MISQLKFFMKFMNNYPVSMRRTRNVRFEMTCVQRFGYGLYLFEIVKFLKFSVLFDIGAYRFKQEILHL